MIIFAEEIKGCVYAYDENKKLIISKLGHLHNYSDNFIAIERTDSSKIIDVYDFKGLRVCSSNELVDTTDLLDLIR